MVKGHLTGGNIHWYGRVSFLFNPVQVLFVCLYIFLIVPVLAFLNFEDERWRTTLRVSRAVQGLLDI